MKYFVDIMSIFDIIDSESRLIFKYIFERWLIMRRRVVKIEEVRRAVGENDNSLGICALVDVENMGWCNDGSTRWYWFDLGGEPVVYFKY